jgi:uncharacterized protein involved in exopolysaccharide biosynthesis
MSVAATKTASEVLQQLDAEELLDRRHRQNQEVIRKRRIARLDYLWRHRKPLARFAVCGAAISVVIALLIPSRFVSTTRLMPPDPPQGQSLALFSALAGRMGGSLGSLGGDLLGLKTSAELFSGLLLSRTVQDDLIEKFDLRKTYGERRWDDARKELTRRTDISIDRKSDIVTIRVTDHDPQRAAQMAQEYIAQLNSVVTQLNTSSAHRERVFLEARLAEVKTSLESSEKEFSEFASKNGTFDIKEQGKAMVESAAALEGQLIAARTELQGLRQIYTNNNVRVRAAQARANELESQLRRISGVTETAAGDHTSSESPLYPSLRKLPLLGVTYADLFRRTKVEETIFETLTQQFELAKVQEAKEIPSVRVLDPADVPEKKVFPPRTLLVLTGTCLALATGILWLFANDRWRKVDPQDPGKLLVLEIVDTVRPRLAYAAESEATVLERVKNALGGSGGDAVSVEPKQ